MARTALRHSSVRSLAFLLFALGVCSSPSAWAQVATAALNGTVTDATGAVVPEATVTLKNTATNVVHTTVTNTSGNYVLVNILPGRYTLTVGKPGFQTATQPEFDLDVNQTTTLDFSLKVGATSQAITVEGAAVGLQTSTSELGSVITQRSVDNLPLNGRNFTQMLNLTPGVSGVNVSQSATSPQFSGNPVGAFSFPAINGQTNRSNLFLVDGLNDEESFGSTYSVPPIIDDIQEFKVDSHNDQAQFGGVLGGVVNVVTKSGTNAFRGEAWDFMRNNAFDSRNPFVAQTTQLQQNEFGANIGGPVILPHYNGKDRTFFFGSYEGVRIHTGNPNQSLVPTPAEINGDFSALSTQLYNPWSTTSTGARTPFLCGSGSSTPVALMPGTMLQAPIGTTMPPAGTSACNILPTGVIDPNMQNVAKLLYGNLTPNLTGIAGKNYQQVILNTQTPDTYAFRVDEQLSSKDAVWGRFTHTNNPNNTPNIFGASTLYDYYAHTYGITWNHTFSPSSLVTLQFGRNYGYSSYPNTFLPQSVSQQLIKAGNYAPSFDCSFVKGPRSCYFIGVDFSDGGIASMQESDTPSVVADIWEGKANFFHTHGRHSLSMGLDINTNGFHQTFNSGYDAFSAAQTANAVTGGTGGFSLASFMLGLPNSVNYRNEYETEYGAYEDGFYVQDSWKATSRLTVNWGVRYDITFLPVFGSPADGNAPVGNMDYNTGNYVIESQPAACNSTNSNPPCLPGGALPPHVTVSPNDHFWNTAYDNIQPRLGLAYRLKDKTVLRASYGRFFDNWAAVIQMAQNQQGTWPSVGQVSSRPLNQDFGPPTVTAENPGVGLQLDTTPYRQSNWFVDPNLENPYSYQWNFGVQQALSQNMTLTVNYVGSTDLRLDVGVQGNQALVPGPGPVPNGCGGLVNPVPKCTDNSAAVAAEGRWLFPYLATNHYDKSIGKAYYDALQVSLDKKAAHGLSFLLSYTWSKTLDLGADEWFGTGTNGTAVETPYDLSNDKGPAGFDLPQIFTASYVYELPFGPGRKWQSGNKGVDDVVGGWQVNGITNFTSGTPFNIVAASGIPNVGTTGITERANLVGNPNLSNQTPAQWFNNANNAAGPAFAVPTCVAGQPGYPNSCYGDFGRNVLRSDGRSNFDLSVFRIFKLTEAMRLEFRAEAFNAFNSPIWGTPGNNISTNLATKTFGVVNSTPTYGYNPRQLQFALKLYY
jgi:hypothetical protein